MGKRKAPVLDAEATAEKVARLTLARAAAYLACRPFARQNAGGARMAVESRRKAGRPGG
jgi:hypothetical protein